MLVKFEQNHMVRTIQNFEPFHKKMVNQIWKRVDTILEDVSVAEPIVQFDAKLLIQRLSSFSVP